MNNFLCEVVRDWDRTYYANVSINGERVKGLPEYVTFNQLSDAIRKETGVQIPLCKDLKFYRLGRKEYSYINNYIEGPCTGMMKPENLKNGPCLAVCANGKKFEAVKTDNNIFFTIPDVPGYEVIGYEQEVQKNLLADQSKPASAQVVTEGKEDDAVVKKLIQAMADYGLSNNWNDSDTIDTLIHVGITQEDFIKAGFGDFVKDYFAEEERSPLEDMVQNAAIRASDPMALHEKEKTLSPERSTPTLPER